MCCVISPQLRPHCISIQAQRLRLSVRCVSQPPLWSIIGVLPSPIPWENCPGSHQTTSPPRTSWRRGSLSSETKTDREEMYLTPRSLYSWYLKSAVKFIKRDQIYFLSLVVKKNLDPTAVDLSFSIADWVSNIYRQWNKNLSVSKTLTGERLPIIRKAVRVESNRKAILFVGAAGILRLLTLAVSGWHGESHRVD